MMVKTRSMFAEAKYVQPEGDKEIVNPEVNMWVKTSLVNIYRKQYTRRFYHAS